MLKKIAFVSAALAVLFAMSGCGSKAPEENIPPPVKPSSDSPLKPEEMGTGEGGGGTASAAASPGENPLPGSTPSTN